MSDNHVLGYLDKSPLSVVYYSVEPPTTLIVFIHGFGGHVTKTWGDFIEVVRNQAEFTTCDIIFYHYKSLKYHMASSALEFYDHLNEWSVLPTIYPGDNRMQATYRNIVIVAHSLGALITRQALLYANNAGNDWVNKVRMLFFAPAHKGARILELSLKCLPGFYGAFGLIAHWFIPVLGDLKEGSEPIKEVMKLTEELLKQGKGDFTRTAISVHAIKDKIIIGGLYCQDPTPEPDYEHDHVSVCKPHPVEFRTPIDYLVSVIK
jgi:hypothetical protein